MTQAGFEPNAIKAYASDGASLAMCSVFFFLTVQANVEIMILNMSQERHSKSLHQKSGSSSYLVRRHISQGEKAS
jgi:hypothetical protein